MKAAEILSFVSSSLRALRDRLTGSGGSAKDVDAMTRGKGFFYLDEKSAGYLAQTGIKPETLAQIFPADGKINPKVPKRFIQLVNGLHAASYKNIDATTARALIALRVAGGTLNRDALHNLLTGKIKVEGVSPETRGVGVRGLDRLVGRIGRGTVETQLSRSFGVNGFCGILGMTSTAGAQNFAVTLNPDAVFSRRFFALIDNATEGQLDELFGGEDEQ